MKEAEHVAAGLRSQLTKELSDHQAKYAQMTSDFQIAEKRCKEEKDALKQQIEALTENNAKLQAELDALSQQYEQSTASLGLEQGR